MSRRLPESSAYLSSCWYQKRNVLNSAELQEILRNYSCDCEVQVRDADLALRPRYLILSYKRGNIKRYANMLLKDAMTVHQKCYGCGNNLLPATMPPNFVPQKPRLVISSLLYFSAL